MFHKALDLDIKTTINKDTAAETKEVRGRTGGPGRPVSPMAPGSPGTVYNQTQTQGHPQ